MQPFWPKLAIRNQKTTLSKKKRTSWMSLTNSKRRTNARTSNSYRCTRVTDLTKNPMASSVLHHKKVSPIAKTTTYGPSSTTVSSQSQSFPSVFHPVTSATSLTHFSVGTTHHRSSEVKAASKPSKTSKETISQT